MIDIEQKALALVNEVAKECWQRPDEPYSFQIFETLCRAIEQHEAFRQEVSDAVGDTRFMVEKHCDTEALVLVSNRLNKFIIPAPKPDPLVDVFCKGLWSEAGLSISTKEIRAALDALGFEIREKNDD